jgi:hypothetical protein
MTAFAAISKLLFGDVSKRLSQWHHCAAIVAACAYQLPVNLAT